MAGATALPAPFKPHLDEVRGVTATRDEQAEQAARDGRAGPAGPDPDAVLPACLSAFTTSCLFALPPLQGFLE